MRKGIDLLLIDPQVDFCDPAGSLYVPGADQDMERVAKFIMDNLRAWHDIHVTVDTHHQFDVAHPVAWLGQDNKHPAPFTIISRLDVVNGVWRASVPPLQTKWEQYVTRLEANRRYPLCIWPPHCLIGSPGHAIYPAVYEALCAWENLAPGNMVDYVTKGSNYKTEHYSAVQADVPDDDDPSTGLNTGLLNTLADDEVEEIYVAGEALSHCLNYTVTDIANNFGEDNIRKFRLLRDGTSPVPVDIFVAAGEKFITDMSARGLRVVTTQDPI